MEKIHYFCIGRVFACPHGKVLCDLRRQEHGQATCTISPVRRRQATAPFNPLTNSPLAVSKLVFTLPPSYAWKAVLPQHAPVTSPEHRDPEDRLAPAPAPEQRRAALEAAGTRAASALFCRYKGLLIIFFRKVCRTFP